LASDQYDAAGKLYRSSFAFESYSYDVQAPFGDTFAIYDFNSGAYNISGLFGAHNGLKYMSELPKESAWSPEARGGAGLRCPVARLPRSGALALALVLSSATAAMAGGFVDVLDSPAPMSPIAARAALQSVVPAGDRLVAVGQRGVVLVSNDAGATWKQSPVPVASDLTSVFFVDEEHGWAVGHDG